MPRKVHYVLSTHWDREWYQTFQYFRFRLVQLIDNLIAGWEDGSLQGPFQTDGQFIILEDYLEVRPERRAQVERLVKEGKFVLGPWYVLPDEFLVSGESLVRNLRMGREKTRALGVQPSNAGFMCDMFGHNSQMPQIFNGFGIQAGLVWRGTNIYEDHQFIWIGADGTRLPSYRFGEIGYCTYAIQVRGAILPPYMLSEADIETRLDGWLANEVSKTVVEPVLAFDGGDHLQWDPQAYSVLARRFGKDSAGFEFVHTSLDAYIQEMVAQTGLITASLSGELREPALNPDAVDAQWLIPGVTSSRVNLKLANAACQDALCQWAEPFSAFANSVLGLEIPQGYLDVAWQWLIQNHPHDSICGCSIDSVHADMLYRFHQTQQIAERLSEEATRRITASVAGEVGPDDLRVGVFNPLAVEREEIVDLDLELPVAWPQFNEMSNQQAKISFRIYGPDGSELPYQRQAQLLGRNRFRIFKTNFPHSYQTNVVRVSLMLRLPALGYTTLTVRPGEPGLPTRHPMLPGMQSAERAMENEFLRVAVEADGTLTVTDKSSGQVYSRLLTFEDRGDIGDGWNHGPAVSDAVFYSNGCHSSISLVCDGLLKTAFRIRTTLEVPAEFDFANMTRGETMTGLVVDSTVTLRAGAKHLEVETVVHNNVRDHRLRVLFPSGASAQTYLADSPFDVVERKIALRADNYLYREPEIDAKPQQSFSAVFDSSRGLGVVSSGLLESAVLDLAEKPLALTLFRATRQTVNTNGEPEGQMQGELRFRYWISPLSGAPDRAQLARLGQMLSGGIHTSQLTSLDVRFHRLDKPLPAEASYLQVGGAVVLTSLRRTSAGLEARVFNPDTNPVEAVFDLSGWPQDCARPGTALPVNFESQPAGSPQVLREGKLTYTLGAKQILTVCFQ